jgi:hypothetical protein
MKSDIITPLLGNPPTKRAKKLIINNGNDSTRFVWTSGAKKLAKKNNICSSKHFRHKDRTGSLYRERYIKYTEREIIYRYEIFRGITIIDVKRKLGLPITRLDWIRHWTPNFT